MNGIILIDKPAGWTSMDVCAKLRGVLHERRIGHSGTLDPMATGLLTVFLGRATRAVEFAEADEKTYLAGMRLGVATDTQDITGRVLSDCAVDITNEQLEAAASAFRGDILQLPPMYSAIKVGGKKLYDIARKGGSVERKARGITIHELEIRGRENDEAQLLVRCSKGTYIRTLCNDIGEKLGCGACMSSLRRTRAGAFSVEQAFTMDKVIATAEVGEAEGLVLPVDTLFSAFAAVTVNGTQEKMLRNGVRFGIAAEDGRYRVYSPESEFLALADVLGGELRVIKSFYEVKDI